MGPTALRYGVAASTRPVDEEGDGLTRLPDEYFDRMYFHSADPWNVSRNWYERRRHAILRAMLPQHRYRNAFEPGCSVGVLTELLAQRCDRVTATDVATAALDGASRRLRASGRRDQVTLLRRSLDEPWPPSGFDLVVLGSKGRSALKDLVIGSVAKRVIELSQVPVLLVR